LHFALRVHLLRRASRALGAAHDSGLTPLVPRSTLTRMLMRGWALVVSSAVAAVVGCATASVEVEGTCVGVRSPDIGCHDNCMWWSCTIAPAGAGPLTSPTCPSEVKAGGSCPVAARCFYCAGGLGDMWKCDPQPGPVGGPGSWQPVGPFLCRP
jgi:hypothetical protein